MKSKSNYKFDKSFKVIICRPYSENCILILYRLNSKHAQYRKLLSICVKEFSMEVIALDKLFCLELITEAFWHQTPSLILLKLKWLKDVLKSQRDLRYELLLMSLQLEIILSWMGRRKCHWAKQIPWTARSILYFGSYSFKLLGFFKLLNLTAIFRKIIYIEINYHIVANWG